MKDWVYILLMTLCFLMGLVIGTLDQCVLRPQRFYDGSVDHIKVFNRALTVEEIQITCGQTIYAEKFFENRHFCPICVEKCVDQMKIFINENLITEVTNEKD